MTSIDHRRPGVPAEDEHQQRAPSHRGAGQVVITPTSEMVADRAEPFPIWRYRSALAIAYVMVLVGIFAIQDVVWGPGRQPASDFERVFSWGAFAWALAAPPALLGLIGLFAWREHRGRPEPIDCYISFRIVSRGQNEEALEATINNIRHEMSELPLFRYIIEVVTDEPIELGFAPDMQHFVVPRDYQTPKRSKYKARALHYALERSPHPDDAWIFHLDEESHITPSLIRGINEAVCEEETSGEYRIGQGAILYHRDLPHYTFLTLADSIRTGDDLGRFHLQHQLGVTIFGLHGSFILARNSVEKDVGFDFGPVGSITEDAFWALKQMENGRRSRWVDGYLAEQSTRSAADFIKQRRRWFVGLILVALYAPVALHYRIGIGLSTVSWSLSWVGIVFTYTNLFVGIEVPFPLRELGNAAFAFYIVLYGLGLHVNAVFQGGLGRVREMLLYPLQVALVPVFSLLEGAGVVYGLLRPDVGGFHVVKK